MHHTDDADDLVAHIIGTHDGLEKEANRAAHRNSMNLSLSQLLFMRRSAGQRRATSAGTWSAGTIPSTAPSRPPRGPHRTPTNLRRRQQPVVRVEIANRIV